jgi:xylan 1,4-beta-xylosidase
VPISNRRCFVLGSLLLGAAGALAQETVPPPAATPVHIQVHLDQRLGASRPIYNWFGYDESNYTTTAKGRKLLGELHDLSPVPVYIRAHHLLTTGDGTPELKWSSTGVYTEGPDGKPVYNWTILDQIFDAYKEAGVRPMVELGFMPKDLAAPTANHPLDPYQVHFPKSTTSGSVSNPPKDYVKWGELIHALTAHLVARYGRDAVLTWYFEVWNEPDIDYWHGTPEQYFQLYDASVAAVRAALPGARVGGPASTGPGGKSGAPFLESFLQHIDQSAASGRPVPLDFLSFHAKGQPKITGGHVEMGLDKELNDAGQGFRIVARHPRLAHLPIILSEADPEGCAACSSKMNPANNYRNGTLYPAYTAAAYKGLLALAAQYHANLISMLSWSFEFEGKDYFEGFRSLATNGVDKPVLNLFRMLGMMGGASVATTSDGAVALDQLVASGVRTHPDVDALATASATRAAVLVWNYHDDADPAPPTPTTLTVSGLPAGAHRVLVHEYRIDDEHSNAYTVWQAMGSPQQPTAEQSATLERRAGLELLHSPTWMDATNGSVTLDQTLPRESVALVVVEWP